MKSKSFFLFGVRGSGKSTWLETFFASEKEGGGILWFDLLDPDLQRKLVLQPKQLLEQAQAKRKVQWIVVDEIQRIPKLLDIAHLGITKHKLKFALTGSSARKLRRGAANLLAGRALTYNLFPFTHKELGNDFKLSRALEYGTLPEAISAPNNRERIRFLRSYANTYLKEEIQSEQLVRNMEPFYHFLAVAAQSAGQPLNYSKLGREAGIDSKSVERYFHLLEDTLVGFFVPAFHRSVRKQQSQAKKFYFIDNGIRRTLSQTVDIPLRPSTYEYGICFEHWLVSEIYKLNSYYESDFKLSYLRTKDGAEVDLILSKPGKPTYLIEIKSKERCSQDDMRTLVQFSPNFRNSRFLLLCKEDKPRKAGIVEIWPWRDGLIELFS